METVDSQDLAEQRTVPQPGSPRMPTWNVDELPDAPVFKWRNWFALLGPGLIMGGTAIGGGEWLMGPAVTARYGGALLWLVTCSILFQVVYNLEISRYTLYTCEPIFTGKCRTWPGPRFWLCVYVLFDFGTLFPYLAANAATPIAALYLGDIPDSANPAHRLLLRGLGYGVFLLAFVPLVFGGRIYRSLKAVMAVKIVIVLGFLLVLSLCYTRPAHWQEIFSGFFKFGNVPVQQVEVSHANDPLEAYESDVDRSRAGDNVQNVFVTLFTDGKLPPIDLSTIALLAAFVAIAGSGGLTNTTISNHTRDHGWGMGRHVGAIPSAVGGHDIKLSHVGAVFVVTADSLARFKHWYRHVLRDQLAVWMPACFLGVALPSMLSIAFLKRGTVADNWTAAGMTANGVYEHVAAASGTTMGQLCWFMTLLCGFLVLAPSMSSIIDSFVRRWVDVSWTASGQLRQWEPRRIKHLYYGVLLGYAVLGMLLLSVARPLTLVLIATNLKNFALGFSCWHTIYVNRVLLPPELRARWITTLILFLGGCFFWMLASITALVAFGVIGAS